jgi:osmoprotectant transport system permease protein
VKRSAALACAVCVVGAAACAAKPRAGGATLVVGSKGFTESVILGEMATMVARAGGVPAEHRREIGGTRVLWAALVRGDIDVYPEYTGTLRKEIFGGRALADTGGLQAALAEAGVRLGPSLGFDNGYVLGMREEVAAKLGVRTISDLRAHPELAFGFSNEFMDRGDGWPALRAAYALPQQNVRGLDHAPRGVGAHQQDELDRFAVLRYLVLPLLARGVGDGHLGLVDAATFVVPEPGSVLIGAEFAPGGAGDLDHGRSAPGRVGGVGR